MGDVVRSDAGTAPTTGGDPDAPWRPGYVGPPPSPAPVAPEARIEPADHSADPPDPWSRAAVESWHHPVVPPPPRRQRVHRSVAPPGAGAPPPGPDVDGLPSNAVTGELVLGGVAVLAAIVLIALVVRSLVVTGSTETIPFAVDLPPRVELQWERELAALETVEAVGADVVLARAGGKLVALDRGTGELRWERASTSGAIASSLELVDDTVLVVDRLSAARTAIVAVDAATGEQRWERSEEGTVLVVATGRVIGAVDAAGEPEVQSLDAVTGRPIGDAVDMSPVVALGGLVAADAPGGVLLLDPRTMTPVGPVVEADGLRSLAAVGDAFVGFDRTNTIIAFDATGARTDARPFVSDAFGDFSGRAELVGAVPGRALGIVASGTSIGFRIVDGTIDVVWEADGRVGPPVRTDVGPVSVARVVDASTGEVDLAVVDATTAEVLAVTDRGVTRESDPVPGRDGYLVAPEVGARDRELAAFGYDGTERWRLPLPGQAQFVVGDDALVVVDRSTNTVRLHR